MKMRANYDVMIKQAEKILRLLIIYVDAKHQLHATVRRLLKRRDHFSQPIDAPTCGHEHGDLPKTLYSVSTPYKPITIRGMRANANFRKIFGRFHGQCPTYDNALAAVSAPLFAASSCC